MKKGMAKIIVFLGSVSLLGTGIILAQNQTDSGIGKRGPGMRPPKYSTIQDIDPAKLEAFCKEVQPQWQKWWQLNKELRELWSKNPPDWNTIEKKEQELIRIRLEIQKKAYEKNLPYGPRGGLRLKRMCGWQSL